MEIMRIYSIVDFYTKLLQVLLSCPPAGKWKKVICFLQMSIYNFVHLYIKHIHMLKYCLTKKIKTERKIVYLRFVKRSAFCLNKIQQITAALYEPSKVYILCCISNCNPQAFPCIIYYPQYSWPTIEFPVEFYICSADLLGIPHTQQRL